MLKITQQKAIRMTMMSRMFQNVLKYARRTFLICDDTQVQQSSQILRKMWTALLYATPTYEITDLRLHPIHTIDHTR